MSPRPSHSVTAERGPSSPRPPGPPGGPAPGSPRRRRLAVALVTAGFTAAVGTVVVASGGPIGGAADVPGHLLASSGGSVTGSPGGSPAHGDDEAGSREPRPEQQARFLTRLGAIAPWLASEADRSLSRARATCDDIRRGVPDGRLVSDAQERFTDVAAGQAAEIVQAVRDWCVS
ncbi:hypothetical protein ACGF0J_32835 [Nonomuraea sp. NPDC047897]|uniref:hypothetical protein n=1 Tax=Nonomuraea sp. NPDC047897 TaxID=3364346 RepID=UPI00371555C2